MEIYVSYKDYNWMMDFAESLLEHCAIAVNGTTTATFGEHTVDFKAPYKRVTMDRLIMFLTNNPSIQEVLFFPQMKPERKQVALTDEAKAVLEILKKVEKLPLADLKAQAGLSNKKWDKSIKELTKNNLAKVEKNDDGLFVEIV